MFGRRILYLAALGGCLVFYWAYQEWFSWFALVGIVCLPWLSLLLSLPAMLTVRLSVKSPARLFRGQRETAVFTHICPLPCPAIKGRLGMTNAISRTFWKKKEGDTLPTEHCGQLTIKPVRARVYDYLGLFWLPVRKTEACTVLVCPEPIPAKNPPDLSRYLVNTWKPKSGGGFAENHELRLYRPGDSLRQIHWKLSAKTGKLILREPMEPLQGLALLTMELSGTPEMIDRKLGRLLWLSQYLLRKEVPHEIRCLTGRGTECFSVAAEEDVHHAVDALLCASAAAPGTEIAPVAASWQYHIGGGPDES